MYGPKHISAYTSDDQPCLFETIFYFTPRAQQKIQVFARLNGANE
jgi:hypothetical protein